MGPGSPLKQFLALSEALGDPVGHRIAVGLEIGPHGFRRLALNLKLDVVVKPVRIAVMVFGPVVVIGHGARVRLPGSEAVSFWSDYPCLCP